MKIATSKSDVNKQVLKMKIVTSSGYEPPALTVKLMALMKFERTCEGRSNDPS